MSEQQYNAAWTVRVSRALLVSLVVFALAPAIAALFNEPRSADIIRVLAIRPLLDGLASIKVAKLNRDMRFRPLAILGLTQALVNTVIAVVLAQTYGVWALVAGTIIGALVYLIVSYIVAPYLPQITLESAAAGPLLRFGRWIFVTSLIAMAGSYVLKVSISRQLGTSELGIYYLATQIAFLPVDVTSEVIEPVAFPLFARLKANLSGLAEAFRLVLSGTMALLLPACTMIFALAPTLVMDVLGPGWEGTVPVIRILTLVTVIGLFGEITVPLFKGLGQPYLVTILEVSQSLILIISIWFLAGSFGLIGAAAAWLPAVAASQIISLIFVRQLLVHPFSGLRAPISAIILASIAGGIVAVGIDRIIPGVIGFILAAGVGATVIGSSLWLLDRRYQFGLVPNLLLFFPQLSFLPGFSRKDGESLHSVSGS